MHEAARQSSTPAPPASSRIAGRNWTKADVRRVDDARGAIAVKDYGARPWALRATVGRWLTAREARAYRAADGIDGLPRFLGRTGPWTLELSWIEGRLLAGLSPAEVDAEVLDRLEAIVAALHERGVALADLHHRDVLVADGGRVYVVDLATAWVAGPRRSGARRWLFERLREQDAIAVARIRARLSGGDESRALAALPPRAVSRWRRARAWKRAFDRLRGRGTRR